MNDTTYAERYGKSLPMALYLHIPFCASKCAYCDFASFADKDSRRLRHDYVEALCRFMGQLHAFGLLGSLDTAYVGGGTPTTLDLEDLVSLAETATGGLGEGARLREFTVEANPESAGDGVLGVLKSRTQVSRISMGIQSLDDRELKALGRIHDADLAKDRLQAAKRLGFVLSADLMCGIPLQTAASWRESLTSLCLLAPDHMSVYPLQIEEGTPFGKRHAQGRLEVADEQRVAAQMEEAQALLEDCGYHRYEVASYAKPGLEARHNCAYWQGAGYLGLGISAASMLNRPAYLRLRRAFPRLPAIPEHTFRVRMTCTSSLSQFIAAEAFDLLRFEFEFMDRPEALAEDLMLGVRRTQGASGELLALSAGCFGAKALSSTLSQVMAADLAQLVMVGPEGGHKPLDMDGRQLEELMEVLAADGLFLEAGQVRLVPTGRGWLLGNELYGALWDLHTGSIQVL